MSRVAVIGAGAWGTALSMVLARGLRHEVSLWAFEKEVCESIRTRRMNDLFLPGFTLPESVAVTTSLSTALDGAETVLTVMPSHHVRRLFQQMRPSLSGKPTVVSATKGIENTSNKRMTEVVAEVAGISHLAALSGPSFAKEVARGDPTALTVASANPEVAAHIQREFSDPAFRVYTSDDVTGVELGGALKNVIAIAAGIVEGLNL
jgi:glycerol-3-phosphate dehydrogenase (NAD(P)+)